jgi:hypothetical protein
MLIEVPPEKRVEWPSHSERACKVLVAGKNLFYVSSVDAPEIDHNKKRMIINIFLLKPKTN